MSEKTMQLTEKFNWVGQEYVTRPQSRYTESFQNCWWLTNDQGEVCLYRHTRSAPLSAQCNANRIIAEKVLGSGSVPGATGMVQIPLAFIDINPADY